MMDNSTANESHISCQPWGGPQTAWSTTASQGLLMNQHAGSQHLGLGSSSDHRQLYNHLHASSQSINDLSTFSPRNSSHHAALNKAPHINSISASNSLFDNTAIQNATHLLSFAEQSPHASSMLMATNQVKTVPVPSLPQSNQGPQPCRPQYLPLLSSHNPHKALFQTQLPSQRLSDGLQDLSVTLPSCRQLNASQTTFAGQNVESAGVAGYSHSFSTSGSHEQPQWAPSSHSRGAVNESGLNGTVHSNNNLPENDGNTPPATDNEKLRLVILQQRAQLLKQLEGIDKLLGSLPPDDCSDGQSPHTPAQASPSKDDSPSCEQTETNDAQSCHSDCSLHSSCDEQHKTQDKSEEPVSPVSPVSPAESVDKESHGCESEDDPEDNGDHGDDDSLSCQSEDAASFCESVPSGPSSPSSETPPVVKKRERSEDSSCEEASASPAPKTRKADHVKPSESVVLPASKTKGKRIYDKRNYCLFCSKPMLKIARHLESVHSDREEVAVAFQYPIFSPERQKIWRKLTNEGNFKHNKDVLRTGKGQLAVHTRPRKPTKAKYFVHCPYCYGLYGKRALFKHMKTCSERSETDNEPQVGKKRIISRCALLAVNCEALGISKDIESILGDMVYDDVTRTVMDDRIILQFGEQIFNEHDRNMKKSQYVRQNLRQVARLVLEAQKVTPLRSVEDFLHPSKFPLVVSTVKVLAGYDTEKKSFSCPSLAVKLGYNLQKICKIVGDNAVKSGDTEAAESAKDFLAVYRRKWNKLISLRALSNLREIKRKKDKEVPLAEDVKSLHYHLEKVHEAVEKKLKENQSPENYAALAKVILARTIFFNRRKAIEVTTMPITAFMSRKKSNAPDETDVSVSKLERTLCSFFTRIEVRGKCGRMVPVLLKPSFESAMELLINVREACGVPAENPYVFGRPCALSAYGGSESIQRHIKECGAKNPVVLTLKQIRRHFATMLQLINLDKDEAAQIFGSNNRIETLLQNNTTLDDAAVESGVRMQCSSAQDSGSEAAHHQQAHLETSPRRNNKSRRRGSEPKSKFKWNDAEVHAVERHLMRFIKEQKVPQKNDCVQCLEAEPRALKARSWKGVKNYVRNRITTLQRQRGVSKDSSEHVKAHKSKRQEVVSGHDNEALGESPASTDAYHNQACGPMRSETIAPSKSEKSREQGSHPKSKSKWDEAEVDAVERHLMRFIDEHRVPQKHDCVECLAAEPRALKARSWKGVKDYVRNRITTLQRQKGLSRTASKSRNGPRQERPRQTDVHFQHL